MSSNQRVKVFKECGQNGVLIRLAVLYHFVSILCKNVYRLHYTVNKSPSVLAAGVFGTGIFHRHIMP